MLKLQDFERWSLLALARFALASIVAFNHLDQYAELGLLSFVPMLGSFEAILGFLLISGYSVTSSYLAKQDGFLLRRLARLYPVYLASMAVAILVTVYVQRQAWPGPFEILANALFLNQLLTEVSIVGPAWSLSLEFWLYALLPLLLKLTPRANRVLAYVSFLAYLVYTVLRTLLHQPYYSGLGYGLNLALLSFAWICGSRLARADGPRGIVLKDVAIMLSVHLLVAVLIQFGSRVKRNAIDQFFSVDVLTYSMEAVTLICIFLLLKHIAQPARPCERPSGTMRLLGDISYPLYLVHIPIYVTASTAGIQSPWLLFAMSMAVAWLMYACFDRYSQRRQHSELRLRARRHAP